MSPATNVQLNFQMVHGMSGRVNGDDPTVDRPNDANSKEEAQASHDFMKQSQCTTTVWGKKVEISWVGRSTSLVLVSLDDQSASTVYRSSLLVTIDIVTSEPFNYNHVRLPLVSLGDNH